MSALQQMDIFEAIRQRDEGIAQVIEASDPDYRDKLITAIEDLAGRNTVFTGDDVRELAGDPPVGTHPNIAGAIFKQAAAAGLIKTVGFGCSRRVKGHGNLVRLWRGVRQ